jgi:hypothetical protein
MANGRDALIWLVNNHWERLAIGLKVQELQGDPFGSEEDPPPFRRRIGHWQKLENF